MSSSESPGEYRSENEYFVGKIVKISENEIKVKRYETDETVTENFAIINEGDRQQPQNVSEDMWTVFHASEIKGTRMRSGRIVLILGEELPYPPSHIRVAAPVKAFTLSPHELHEYYDAFSVGECNKRHGRECRTIGIHIPAVAWYLDEPVEGIPSFGRNKRSSLKKILYKPYSKLRKFASFKPKTGSWTLAISIYLHSNSDEIEGPVFTPVTITENYSFQTFTQEDSLKLMCSVFQEHNAQKILKGKHFWRLAAGEKKNFKPTFVTSEALDSYTCHITRILKEHCSSYVIASCKANRSSTKTINKLMTNDDISDESAHMDYFISENQLNEAANSGSTNDAMKWLATGIQIMSFRETEEETAKMSKTLMEVVRGKDIGLTDVHLICTFGQRGVPYIVNQQILIRCMLGMPSLYEKVDLAGIILPRYSEPKLVQALIRKNDPEFLHVNYIDLLGIDVTLRKLAYSEMGAAIKRTEQGSLDLNWKNAHCDVIEYDKVFKTTGTEVANCFSLLGTSSSSSDSIMKLERVELPPPFTMPSKEELKLTPVPGMIIRMQICDFTAHHPSQVAFRMIRVGKNGHICLAHMNSPQKMFATDNKELLPYIKDFTEKSKIMKIHPTESGRAIKWSGRYNAGGWFKTDRPIKKGQLLCIRKDIFEAEKVKYVWNAHAIVAEEQTNDGEIFFSVCSLLQPGEMAESDNFVVEYIELREENEN